MIPPSDSSAAPALPCVDLWTDGACSDNPGPGGWAALLRIGARERELSDGAPETTNNRMELLSVIEGLRALNRPCRVRIHLDAAYVMHGFTKGWVHGWQRNGWRTSAKQPVKNQDLWEQLIEQVARHRVNWVLVKGHAGVAFNERVDTLAVAQRDRYAGR
jgi:ribonuclease HI